jgi:hypothetical protein
MTTLPYESSDLLETTRLLDHLVWSYRRAIDRTPRAFLTAEHICLSDYAARTVGLIRAIMEDDSRRRGVSFHHRPRPPNSPQRAAHATPQRTALDVREPTAAAAPFDALGPPPQPPPYVEPHPLDEFDASVAEEARSAAEDERTTPNCAPRRMRPR